MGTADFIAALLLIFIDELVVIIRILTGHDKSPKDSDINEIIDRLQKEKLQQRLNPTTIQNQKNK